MWTRVQMLSAYDMASRNVPLAEIAPVVGHAPAEVDIALWTMMGRTVQDALVILNARQIRTAI